MDPDKGFAVQMTVEEGLVTEPTTCMQCGLVYTSSDGERRIRRVLPNQMSMFDVQWGHMQSLCSLAPRIVRS